MIFHRVRFAGIDSRLGLRFSKVVSGLAKCALPYALMRWWLLKRHGIKLDEPLLHYPGFFKRVRRTVKFLLPCFLVGNYWRVMRAVLEENYMEEDEPSPPQQEPPPFVSCADLLRVVALEGFPAFGTASLANEDDSDLALLVSHELSLTGAPMVLLHLAVEFRRKGKTVLVLSFCDGPLRERLVAEGFAVVVVERSKCSAFAFRAREIADCFVLNTLETVDVAVRLDGLPVPVLWWIHESSESYHAYVRAHLPRTLRENMHVYCGGGFAQRELLRRRPDYRTGVLLYGLPETAEDEAGPEACFDLPVRSGKKILACVGTLCERKGQRILLPAVRQMTPVERDRIAVVFVGAGYDQDVLRCVNEARAEFPDTVFYIESVEPQRLPAFYRAIDALVCPSLADPMPVVVTEALMRRVVAICSESIGTRQLANIETAAFWYGDDDPGKLCARIREFLASDAASLAKRRENGRRIYEEQFAPEVFSRNVDGVLAELEADACGLLPCEDKVSVVIPTYRAGEAFASNLRRLRAQKGVPSVELVVVDSGSTDGTLATAEAFGARVVKIPHEAFSHSAARNLGIQAATGRYVVLMTQDAVPVGKRWLHKLLQPLLGGRAVAASCRQVPVPSCTLYGRICNRLHCEAMGLYEDRIAVWPEDTSYMSLRRSAQLDDVACALVKSVCAEFPYRGEYAEDLDLGLHLLRAGHRLALLGQVVVAHSHNRRPGYYFRRGIVDVLAVKRLIPNCPAENASEARVASLFVTAFATVGRLVREMRDARAETVEEILVDLKSAHEKTRRAVRLAFANVKTLVAEADGDAELAEVAKALLDHYRNGLAFAPELSDAVASAVVRGVRDCLRTEEYRPASSWGDEVADCLTETFGTSAGALFGAYAATHSRESSYLLELIKRHQSGV